jgi:prefoldin beta subunit
MEDLPPQLKHMVAQYQQAQQHAQALASQRQQLELLMLETKKAVEALEKAPQGAAVYRSVGPLLLRASREELKKELEEERETLELRVKTLERQEERVTERLRELQQKLEEALKTKKPEA